MITSEDKLSHLEHAEDHLLNAGDKGFAHSFHTLNDVHNALRGEKNNTKITTKFDGSPAIVFGTHPQTGKFFVATKSAFNKTPKINYTHDDIKRNHTSEGLRQKLSAALDHLHKVTPPGRIFQGDMMHTHHDLESSGGKIHFKPNTIKYSVDANSEEGKAAKRSKVGVAVHTEYKGKSIEDMKAELAPDTSAFKKHPDVHMMSAEMDLKKAHYPQELQDKFEKHLATATMKSTDVDYKKLTGHEGHLKTYINSTVRNGTKPSVEGYKAHLKRVAAKDVDSVKTPAYKEKKQKEHEMFQKSAERNAKHIDATLKAHSHLQKAKDVLVKALAHHSDYEHTIDGKPSAPEGFVAIRDGKPSKLVNRAEFSRANFAISSNK